MWFKGISWGQGRLRRQSCPAELLSSSSRRATLRMSLLLFALLSPALAGPGLIQNGSIGHHEMLANTTLTAESQRIIDPWLQQHMYHYGNYDTQFVDTSRDLLKVICCRFGSLSYFVPGTGHVQHLAEKRYVPPANF